MLIQGRTLGFLTVILAALSTSGLHAQCATCQSDWPAGGGVATGAGYGTQSGFGNYRDQSGHLLHKIEARNAAWWKPFNCWDRQAYQGTWSTFVQAGWQNACILRDCHFDPESGRLNNLGLMHLGEIMASARTNQVFVASQFNPKLAESRLDAVREVIAENYGAERASLVAVSTDEPIRFNGARAQAVLGAYNSSIPAPTIQAAAAGGASTASSGQ